LYQKNIINKIPNQRKRELNDRLMLFFTGFTRFSADVQQKTSQSMPDKIKQLLRMKEMVNEAERILISKGSLDEFGRLLYESWQLKQLSGQGFAKVILSVGYMAEVIQQYFGASYAGMELLYSIEDEPLGTGGEKSHGFVFR